MVTSRTLNFSVPVHKTIRRQSLNYLYSDNICVFFYIHIFHAVSKIPCLCTKKCIDKNNEIMEKIETSHFENTNFKKYIFLNLFFLKSNFEENENPI